MAQKGSGSTPHGRSGNGHDDDARAPRHPGSRRESPEVYRRRRLVAALAASVLLVLVAVGLVSAVAGMLGPEDTGDAPAPDAATASAAAASEEPFADFTPRPDESASASASASATEGPVEECGPDLAVRASTDRESYPEDVDPVLVLTLENTGEDPCRVNAGTSRMVYEVTSGSDTVFDSRHCQAGSEDAEVTLEPGEEASARLTWDRVRTAEDCAEAGGEAQPGYYRLVTSLGERTADPAPFVLE
ncbi:DUF4232 domain-containing protein [uncultured Kocuria sp.]|uniref:DUF4232 domain-containing protein n=1 Tax=uncultured Kocuria sp. TaxID=259305 RepID=UPI0026201EC8|nr:DUF4232 domain-containing protein [uncultured Kocuria sp.]